MIITLQTEISNASLQIGDTAYYSTGLSTFSSNTASQTSLNVDDVPIKIGKIDNIVGNTIMISNPVITPTQPEIDNGAFLMFQKNKTVNNTSLVGYYAEVEIKNNSTEEAELFSLSSEAVESSK